MASGISQYLENKLTDLCFRLGTFPAPTTIYIALLSTAAVYTDTGTTLTGGGGTGVELTSTGSYARVAYTPSASANWQNTQGNVSGVSTGTTGLTNNNTTITFPTATAPWSAPVVAVAIVDAASNGNLLWFGTLTASKTVGTGDVFSFQANQLSVSLAGC